MKVTGPGPISSSSKIGGTKGRADGSFSKLLDSSSESGEAEGAGMVSHVAPVAFVSDVNPDGKGRRRQLLEDADALLDELLKIRDALLFGNLSITDLRAIETRLAKIEANSDDPKLNELIEEIKTRAAVELAKLGVF